MRTSPVAGGGSRRHHPTALAARAPPREVTPRPPHRCTGHGPRAQPPSGRGGVPETRRRGGRDHPPRGRPRCAPRSAPASLPSRARPEPGATASLAAAARTLSSCRIATRATLAISASTACCAGSAASAGTPVSGVRLGVIWYRTDSRIVASDPDNDGKHVGYLRVGNESTYRPCDPPLYDGLRAIVGRQRAARRSRRTVLPPRSGHPAGVLLLYRSSRLRGTPRRAGRAIRAGASSRGAARCARGSQVLFDRVPCAPATGPANSQTAFTTLPATPASSHPRHRAKWATAT